MIVKVKNQSKDGWWYYDCRKCHYTIVPFDAVKENLTHHDLAVVNDYREEGNGQNDPYVSIIIWFERGEEFSILTNSTVFLCNDVGLYKGKFNTSR